ncbi:Gfo/Idh/MocA family oxidoreductase [Frigoribacterium sp. PhB116]|uniref:Gfo/Idh/MocA family protein n=1 Tax=Frigoribacterium sp. PhB116 TaxID=2485174 RepID=UPI0010E5D277|nr:putative dehydrogenase [Frigoribacterium sp. PhB116]
MTDVGEAAPPLADVAPTRRAAASVAPLRVGVVGGGFMGRVHTAAARAAGAQVVAVASSSPASASFAAAALGVPTAHDSVQDLLDDPGVDVVHLCTPNALHAGLALAAFSAGKHVVCEKPLATSTAEADELVRAARAAGRTAAVPFVYRYHPMVREARARVASGVTGRVLSVRGSYLQDWLLDRDDVDWRVESASGGPSRAFADIGSHLVDLVEFVLGDRVAALSAVLDRAHAERGGRPVDTEDEAALVFETAAGVIGTLFVSQVAPGRKNRLLVDVAGTAESLEFSQEEPDRLWIGRRAASEVVSRDAARLVQDAARLSTLPAGHPMGYHDAFAAFVRDVHDAVRGGRPEGLPTFEDGRRAVVVTESVLLAAAERRWVDVPS